MKLLHLGCGEVRPGDPWTNMDTYGKGLPNDLVWNMNTHPWPLPNEVFDGITAMHVFEHFNADQLQCILGECYRVLKPGGVLRCGVPDATHFRRVYEAGKDTRELAVEMFGEPNLHPDYHTFMGWALFLYGDHRQVFTEDALWCTLVNREYPPKQESFSPKDVVRVDFQQTSRPGHYCAGQVAQIDNRAKFTLYMEAFK